MGKIEIDGRNIIISKGFVDLTGDNESDAEEEKKETGDESERGESSQEADEEDVPALTKQQVEQLIASKKRSLYIFKWIKDVDHDSDFWADHDDDAHGDPQSFEDDPDFAEGFIWDCCKQLATEKSCMNSRHEVMEERSHKRTRH
ncbi:hypothetical protein EYC80_002813 [Monilinia laxa]|uniref:Uncharacterized protein n=1 Tax=Monilinia laxa TaxID=61186 RepID=A0A5N6KBZ2_MONLA|nr:hypothetical protein EYC80_002813 [Monilinia laxa]